MDENPYKSPESEPERRRKSPIKPHNWIAAVALPAMLAAILTMRFSGQSSLTQERAYLVLNVALLFMVAWCAFHWHPKTGNSDRPSRLLAFLPAILFAPVALWTIIEWLLGL